MSAESEEEKRKRWAAAAAKSYMTPSMMHALSMSKQQSQRKYKEAYTNSKAKGYTSVAATPELENAKRMTKLVSKSKYTSEFEKNKAKFTQVADDPETTRVKKMTNQISNNAYKGKELASEKDRKRREKAAARNEERAGSALAKTKANEPSTQAASYKENDVQHDSPQDQLYSEPERRDASGLDEQDMVKTEEEKEPEDPNAGYGEQENKGELAGNEENDVVSSVPGQAENGYQENGTHDEESNGVESSNAGQYEDNVEQQDEDTPEEKPDAEEPAQLGYPTDNTSYDETSTEPNQTEQSSYDEPAAGGSLDDFYASLE